MPIRRVESHDPHFADRIRLQEQVTLLQGQVGKLLEMVREANENERKAYQSMCNTLGRAQFALPPFPNAATAPGLTEDPLILESRVVNGSDEAERLNRSARADAKIALAEYLERNRGTRQT